MWIFSREGCGNSRITPQLPRWQGWAKAAKEKLDKLTQAAA